MPEIEISKKIKWECQNCGECCKGKIISKGKNISIQKEGKWICHFFDHNSKLCSDYNHRPFFCKLFPFVMGLDKIKVGEKAIPQNAFKLENMKIHTECKGFGKGKRIYANNKLQKELKELGYEFAINFKKKFENSNKTHLW